MSKTKRTFALAILPVLLFTATACDSGSSKSSSSKSTSAASSASSSTSSALSKPVTNGSMSSIKLDTKNANDPKVTIPKDKLPFGTKNLEQKVIKEGTGKMLTSADYASVDYVIVNGTTGQTVASSFGKQVASIDMSNSSSIPPGMLKVLQQHKVGSQVLVSMPATQAFGPNGWAEAGIGGNDDIVMYIDMKSSEPYKVSCDTPKDDPSLPTAEVSSDPKKPSKLTFPKGKSAPTKLECATLSKGNGKVVEKGQTISVLYTGQVWNGKVFDSSAKNGGQAASFPIGVGQVVAGWDRTLVGAHVGDKLLIVIPPKDGYGTAGNSQAGIKGTDTIVFVVEIKSAK